MGWRKVVGKIGMAIGGLVAWMRSSRPATKSAVVRASFKPVNQDDPDSLFVVSIICLTKPDKTDGLIEERERCPAFKVLEDKKTVALNDRWSVMALKSANGEVHRLIQVDKTYLGANWVREYDFPEGTLTITVEEQ